MGKKQGSERKRLLLFIVACLLLVGSAYLVSQVALGTDLGKRALAWTGKEDIGIKRGQIGRAHV